MDGVKCAHPQCTCLVDLGQLYCSPKCHELDIADGEAAPFEHCGCRHPACDRGR